MSESEKDPGLVRFLEMVSSDKKAMELFEKWRWGNCRTCPRCNCDETINAVHKSMPYWCPKCRKYFSVKIGTIMERSKIGYQKWMIALYELLFTKKSKSSIELGRLLEITQKSSWFLGHRIRTGFPDEIIKAFIAEIDEMYAGGLEKYKHVDKKLKKGRGGVGKTPVLGILDREKNQVKLQVIPDAKVATILKLIKEYVKPGGTIYTDDAKVYKCLENHGFLHESVNHSEGEYGRDDVHTNGIESVWTIPRRIIHGIYHKTSPKHLQLYMYEFAFRKNTVGQKVMEKIERAFSGFVGKRLMYKDLVATS